MRYGVRMIVLSACLVGMMSASAQSKKSGRVKPEDMRVDMDSPTFVPMVKVSKTLYEGDSIQYVELNNIYVSEEPTFKNEIVETGAYLETLPNEKARKEHMKRVEANLKEEYGPRMKKLTYSQGKLLIKLVYRECDSSSYELIQAFMGPVKAGIWQAFAWAFGASLMKKYDAEGVDRLTERIVLQVEAGQL